MKIITDSTADLSAVEYSKYRISFVPLTIHLDGKSWQDFHDIDPDEYYAMLRKTRAFPSTSQPSPQDFIDTYAPFVAAGEPILSIHLSSRLSGTYQSASLAKCHFPDAQIEVLDSAQASLGLGLMLLLCGTKMESGVPFDEVVRFATDLRPKVETYFSVDSLDHLQRGGRIGKAQAFLGTLMKVKPLLRLSGGEILPIEKIRTTDRLLNRFVELVRQAAADGSKVFLSTGESDNSELVSELLKEILEIPGVSLVHRCKLGGVITSHAGPGALAITFVRQ
jgi:DegV family protein with EDD domain